MGVIEHHSEAQQRKIQRLGEQIRAMNRTMSDKCHALELAERQVRDLTAEISRLQARLAAAQSMGEV